MTSETDLKRANKSETRELIADLISQYIDETTDDYTIENLCADWVIDARELEDVDISDYCEEVALDYALAIRPEIDYEDNPF